LYSFPSRNSCSYQYLEKTAQAIEKLAKENKMPVVGRVPFDPVFTESMVKGQTVLEYVGNSEIRSSISEIWLNIRNKLVL